MKIFNFIGWLIYLERYEDYSKKGVTYINRYLFYRDKPVYQSTSTIPEWKRPTPNFGYLREGWEDQGRAIHIELTDEERIPGIEITKPYYFLDEEYPKNKDGTESSPPPYGTLIINDGTIIFKQLSSKSIKYLSDEIVKNKIEKIFQKYCFEHKKNNWIIPRNYPDIINDVKQDLNDFMQCALWLKSSYDARDLKNYEE